jgi:hypothetical protein
MNRLARTGVLALKSCLQFSLLGLEQIENKGPEKFARKHFPGMLIVGFPKYLTQPFRHFEQTKPTGEKPMKAMFQHK